jgi:hypothetical protein
MKTIPIQTDDTVQAPIVGDDFHAAASSDQARVDAELRAFAEDPTGYIERRYPELVSYDFPVYAGINIKIQGKKSGRAFPFRLNRIQRRLWTWMLEDMAAHRPVRWFIVKARQEGVSTFFLSLFYWLASLRANRNALVVTQDEASCVHFNSRVRSMHAQCIDLLKSPTVVDRRDLVHFGNKTHQRQKGAGTGLDSRLIFASASHSELGRAYNFHAVLLSEFAIWPDMGIDVESQLTALNQTIEDLPGTIIILESTAKGKNAASAIWDDPGNGFRKVFLSYVAHDQYRKPLKPGETIEDLCNADESGGKSTRYGNEIAEKRLIEGELRLWYPEELEKGGDDWLKAEILARLNWRRDVIDKKCLGDVQKFRQEYPTTAAHAFSSTARNVFDQSSLELMRAHVESEELAPVRYSYIHDPDVTDPNLKFQINPFGHLHVYRHPQPGQQYVIAGDPGMGIQNSGDPSALIVLAVPDLEEVASYNQIVTPDRFAEMAHYLGLIYNGALLGIENNERGGFAANLALSTSLHYPRLYWRFDPFDKRTAGKPGFSTTGTNKAVIVAAAQQAIRDHEILLRTEELLDQLEHYLLDEKGEMRGAQGWNDDLVSALLIAIHLSTKVHMFAPAKREPPPGSFDWHVRKHEERQRPGLMGYNRRR